MSKLKTLSILDAAIVLGYKPTGCKSSTELLIISAEKYLQQFELDQVELPKAFYRPDGTISRHCYKETQIKNILKDRETNND